ncbi:GGDEF domain-containing protein [Azonexus fungiphilus]|uniref:GGDEF domain-containing protein n=1 Tax=Azonexus fungiphilus TaxID=146940 RepID=UPI001C2CB7D8|nr:diguanylate cyclase [Azonexus fungiphilus]
MYLTTNGGKIALAQLIDGACEAEDFFPAFGEGGRWLFFTAAAIRNEGGEIRATVSIGVAGWRAGEDEQTLIRRADEAVYAAKRRGKNCVVEV